jgi:hypothetical protein
MIEHLPTLRLYAWLLPFILVGCYKDSIDDFAEEETVIQNVVLGQQEADDALDIVYQSEVYQMLHPGQDIILNECATISNDPTNKVLTIDFGSKSAGCSSFFGRFRRGKIISNYEGNLGDTLASRTLTFDNFVADNRSISGTVTLDSQSFNFVHQIVARRSVKDFQVLFPGGGGITFNGAQIRTWHSGMADTIEFNNTYVLQGDLEGESSTGRSFTSSITKDVFINFYCASQGGGYARTVGLVELTHLEGYPDRTRTVDYGDSTCNKAAHVTTFRRSYGIGTD